MKKHRLLPLSLMSLTAIATLAFVLWPSDSYAWGPLAHLNFSSGALESLWVLGPATRSILSHYTNEYLYGSLAADIIVGKNLARYAVHCHNWAVGFNVLERSKNDAQRAFSLGFLSHLAVDTIAHNYYVPYKTVQSFSSRAAGHAYWEMRYDQRLSPELWKLARQVSHATYREHDEHLEECLADSYVIPFSISKKMFGSMLLAARLKKWQRMSQVLAAERDESLHEEEVRECQKLAVGQIVDMLKDGPKAQCTQADPTGGRNLHMATQLRQALKIRKDLSEKDTDEVVRQSRPAFKAGIYGRLMLPPLPDGEAVQAA
jgi:hypothetical protein